MFHFKAVPPSQRTEFRIPVRNHRAEGGVPRRRAPAAPAAERLHDEGAGRGVARGVVERCVEVAPEVLKRAPR